MDTIPWMSLVGGLMVGISVATLMLFTGKTAGISGIVYGAIENPDRFWRILFLVAMALGGGLAVYAFDQFLPDHYSSSWLRVIVAGLLVGAGTRLANGCTSGHGICGIGRFSKRSLVATCLFMASAMLTVWVMS